MTEDELRARVVHERRIRALSIRGAATLGSTSNTTWGEWEKGTRPLSDAVRVAVATAFDWSMDWPENPPPFPIAEPGGPTLSGLDEKLDQVLSVLERMAPELSKIAEQLASPPATRKRQPRRGAGVAGAPDL